MLCGWSVEPPGRGAFSDRRSLRRRGYSGPSYTRSHMHPFRPWRLPRACLVMQQAPRHVARLHFSRCEILFVRTPRLCEIQIVLLTRSAGSDAGAWFSSQQISPCEGPCSSVGNGNAAGHDVATTGHIFGGPHPLPIVASFVHHDPHGPSPALASAAVLSATGSQAALLLSSWTDSAKQPAGMTARLGGVHLDLQQMIPLHAGPQVPPEGITGKG